MLAPSSLLQLVLLPVLYWWQPVITRLLLGNFLEALPEDKPLASCSTVMNAV